MSNVKRVVMTGSRTWTDEAIIKEALCEALEYFNLEENPEKLILINGTAAGADRMASKIAKSLNMTVEDFPARWNTHSEGKCLPEKPDNGSRCYFGRPTCKLAGHRRNDEMLDSGAILLLAFVHNNSKGATHAVKSAESRHIETWVYSVDD